MRTAPFTRLGILVATLALSLTLGAWAFGGGALFSPGALSGARGAALGGITAHADLDERCASCHPAPWSRERMNALCLRCHGDIRSQLADTSSLHGAFGDARDCRACHTEHGGRTASLTRFDLEGDAHDRFGFSLAVHETTADGARFACTDCHEKVGFAFERARCRTCHDGYQRDFTLAHVQEWGADCLTCHDGSDRFDAEHFSHDSTSLALTGGHADIRCAECHQGARKPADFQVGASACVDCHEPDDPHRGEFGADCAACHATNKWEDVRFEHDFPLDHGRERRAPTECRVCHQDAPRSYETWTCYGCHEHSEAGIRAEHLEEGIRDYADCLRCHPTGREDEGEGVERGHSRRNVDDD